METDKFQTAALERIVTNSSVISIISALLPLLGKKVEKLPAEKKRRVLKRIRKDVRRLNKRIAKGKYTEPQAKLFMEQLLSIY